MTAMTFEEMKAALASSRGATLVEVTHAPQFFPTPLDLVRKMIDRAEIRPTDDCLEPSAGSGNIVRALKEAASAARIVAVEIDARLAGRVNATVACLHGDFLKQSPTDLGTFDRIVMNPPFKNGQDAAHVRHAATFLNSGGILVALVSPAYTYSSRRPYPAFRQWLQSQDYTAEEIPAGAFKESGTQIATRLLVIRNKRRP